MGALSSDRGVSEPADPRAWSIGARWIKAHPTRLLAVVAALIYQQACG